MLTHQHQGQQEGLLNQPAQSAPGLTQICSSRGLAHQVSAARALLVKGPTAEGQCRHTFSPARERGGVHRRDCSPSASRLASGPALGPSKPSPPVPARQQKSHDGVLLPEPCSSTKRLQQELRPCQCCLLSDNQEHIHHPALLRSSSRTCICSHHV